MAVALRHRGPDDSGVEIEGNVGLVNARLAILDPSPSGHQPMSDAARGWTLTYNGEIFNHVELRAELGDRHYRGHSDTETLLRALAISGPAVLGRLNGFFSFAALDERGRRLLLARDRFGVKPLYVARTNGEIWFASEMRALLAGGVPAQPNLDILTHAATHGWPYGRSTPLESVERVLPGTMLVVDTETLQVTERRWFEPTDYVEPDIRSELASTARGALSDRLEEALGAAIRRRMVADVPVGVMCSGGLDSTLVTALMHGEDPSVVAFNASLADEPREDEHRWAQRATEALGCELDTVSISSQDWRAALVQSVWHHEYPIDNPSSVSISLIARRARERGVKVLLTGEAADELFCGYQKSYPRDRALLPFWRQMERAVRRRLDRAALTARAYGVRGTSEIVLDRMIRKLSRRDGKAPDLPPEAPEVSAHVADVRERAARAYGDRGGVRRDFEGGLLAELSSGPFPFLLNRQDKDAMAASVETRLPFLDPEVVRLAVNLPIEARIGPRPKGVLADVASRHIPARIVNRPKQAGMFFDPRDSRARIMDAARPEFLEQGVLRDLLGIEERRFRELIADTTSGYTVQRMWSAEIWCRLFLEHHDVQRVESELWAPAP